MVRIAKSTTKSTRKLKCSFTWIRGLLFISILLYAWIFSMEKIMDDSNFDGSYNNNKNNDPHQKNNNNNNNESPLIESYNEIKEYLRNTSSSILKQQEQPQKQKQTMTKERQEEDISLKPGGDQQYEHHNTNVGDDKTTKYHIVFSTDCSAFQHWQSYLLFYSAMKIQQPGKITRILSGCNEEEKKNEINFFKTHIQSSMISSSSFHLHFTPKFSDVIVQENETNVKNNNNKKTGFDSEYKFFNKPFGLHHWMEHGGGEDSNGSINLLHNDNDLSSSSPKDEEDTIIILLDPDMVLLRPITIETIGMSVTHGQPVAQRYGFGSLWKKLNINKIAGADSPANLISHAEARKSYPVGPPYIATSRDMYQIATYWTKFVRDVHAEDPNLLSEMYAFSIAAAHLKLPHTVTPSFMVSNTGMSNRDEGWKAIDDIPSSDVCNMNNSNNSQMPIVFHYCQRYMLGKFIFAKRRVPYTFFDCQQHPLLAPPYENFGTLYNYRINPAMDRKELNSLQIKREAYSICTMTKYINDALNFFQNNNNQCPKSNNGNSNPEYTEYWNLWTRKIWRERKREKL